MRFRIVNGDGEVAGAHEFVDDAVDGGEELLQVLGGAGLFGNAIEGGAESFGALALGDVAIDGVEGGDFAIDDQRSGGNGNVEQGAILREALGFESDGLAALEALRDPMCFGGAIGREDDLIDRFAQDLRRGVAKQALKFLIDALDAEGIVGDDERVGRILKELFEILAADIESFFRSCVSSNFFLWKSFSRNFLRGSSRQEPFPRDSFLRNSFLRNSRKEKMAARRGWARRVERTLAGFRARALDADAWHAQVPETAAHG